MPQTDLEIVVDDPTAPEDDSPSLVSSGTIEIFVCLLLLALAATLGYDNWRTGASWDATGPEPVSGDISSGFSSGLTRVFSWDIGSPIMNPGGGRVKSAGGRCGALLDGFV